MGLKSSGRVQLRDELAFEAFAIDYNFCLTGENKPLLTRPKENYERMQNRGSQYSISLRHFNSCLFLSPGSIKIVQTKFILVT